MRYQKIVFVVRSVIQKTITACGLIQNWTYQELGQEKKRFFFFKMCCTTKLAIKGALVSDDRWEHANVKPFDRSN